MNRKYQPGIRLRFTLRFHTSISLSVAVDIERDQDGISVTTDIHKMNRKYNLISDWDSHLDSILVSHFQLQLTLRFHIDLSSSILVVTDIYKMDGKYQSDIRLRFTLRFHTSISLSVAADIERLRWNQIPYLDSIMYSQCQIQVQSRFHLDLSSSMSVVTDIYKMDGEYNLISDWDSHLDSILVSHFQL